jgi:hypothetical protein
MPRLSLFNSKLMTMVVQLRATKELVDLTATSTGVLTWSQIERMQNSLGASKVAAQECLAEGALNQAFAETTLSGINGPATLAELQSQLDVINTAYGEWNTALASGLASLPASAFMTMVDVGDGQIRLVRPTSLTVGQSDGFRNIPALATLVTALATIGG